MVFFTPKILEVLEFGYYFWPFFVILLCVISVLSYFYNLWVVSRTLEWVPRPPSLPILGNAVDFIGKSVTDHWKISLNWLDKYDGMVQVWIIHRPTIVVSKKKLVERLLKGSGDTLTRKSEQYSFLSDIFGSSLLTYSAIDWMVRRNMLEPFFHDSLLNRSIFKISHHARVLVSHLHDKAKKSKIIDVQHYSKMSTLDVTTDSFLGVSPNYLEQSNQSYLDAIKTSTDIMIKRSCTPLFNWSIFYFFTLTRILQFKASRTLNEFSNKIIQKRKNTRKNDISSAGQEKKSVKNNFLDFLLEKEEDKLLQEKEVQSEVNTFIFSANETVAAGIAFTLYLLGQHPRMQLKIHKEINLVCPELSSDKEITMAQLSKMVLLDRCIKESLRLYPPVPWIGRVLKNYIKIDSDKKLPEGVNVAINVYKMHRNEKYYTNPNEFDPDRFLNTSTDGNEGYSYIPFGAGWRKCIGQKFALLEIKIIILHILNHYSVISLDKPEDLEIYGNIILRSSNGLRVRLNQRTQTKEKETDDQCKTV